MCTVIPAIESGLRLTSPAWSPDADLEPDEPHFVADVPRAADRTRRAVERREHPVAGGVAEPSAVAGEHLAGSLLEAVEQDAPAAVTDLAHLLGRPDDVDEEHCREDAIGVLRLRPRARDELLDRAERDPASGSGQWSALSRSTSRAPRMCSAR